MGACRFCDAGHDGLRAGCPGLLPPDQQPSPPPTLAEACEVIRTLLNYCLTGSETLAAEKFLERAEPRRRR
jgi:hypothetical protein